MATVGFWDNVIKNVVWDAKRNFTVKLVEKMEQPTFSRGSAPISLMFAPPSCRDSYLKPFCKAGEFLKAVVHPASKKSYASVITNIHDTTRRLVLETIKSTDHDPVYPKHWEGLEGQIDPFYRKGPSYNIDRDRSFLGRMPLMEMSLKYMRYELPADHTSKVAAQYGKALANAALSAAMVFLVNALIRP